MLISVLSTYASKKPSDFPSDQMKSHSEKIPKALADFVTMISGFYLESIYQTDGPGVIAMCGAGVGELRPVVTDIDGVPLVVNSEAHSEEMSASGSRKALRHRFDRA